MPTGVYERKHHSDETKKKISLSLQGHEVSQQTRDKISKNNAKIWLGKKRPGLKHCGQFKKGIVPWSKGKKLPQFSGKNSSNWKGGKTITSIGYVLVRKPNHPFCNPNGYIFEHRLVMEKHIGRYLKPFEVVHHINKIKTDNRLENLKLFANHSKHCKFKKPTRRRLPHK